MSKISMKSLKTLVFTLTLCFSALLAQAQVEEITIEKAVELALENNVQYKQAKNNIINNKESILQAKGNFLPNLNGNFGGGSSSGFQFNNATGEFDDFIINSLSGGLSAGINVFNGFRNIETLRQAESSNVSAEKRLERLKEQVIFDTATSYLTILLNRNLVEISEENLKASQEQLSLVLEQVKVGARPIVDQYNQESVVATNELDLIRRTNELNISQLRLVRSLQLDPLKKYSFAQPGVNITNMTPKSYNLSDLYDMAMQNRSDLEAQLADIEASKNAINIAKSGLYPTISASANLSSRYNDQTRAFELINGTPERVKVDFNDQFFTRNVQRSGNVSLRIPIFNNFSVRRNIESAKVQFKNAQIQLKDQKLGVMVEVQQALNDYNALVKEFETNDKALLASKQNFEITRERYNVGASTLIELTQANAQYVNAQSNSVRTVYNLIFQEKVLDFFVGRLTQDLTIN
jgi:outer membrane protein